MKEVYEKLVENLASMTPEEKEREWEELKKYNEIGPEVKEILKLNKMEQFNLQKYLANPSRKVVTRDGRSVRILCTDVKGYCSVLALATYNGIEFPLICSEIGEGDFEKDDLFFSTETKVGWVNIYKMPDTDGLETSIIFDTKEEAKKSAKSLPNYITTIKIEWEE